MVVYVVKAGGSDVKMRLRSWSSSGCCTDAKRSLTWPYARYEYQEENNYALDPGDHYGKCVCMADLRMFRLIDTFGRKLKPEAESCGLLSR